MAVSQEQMKYIRMLAEIEYVIASSNEMFALVEFLTECDTGTDPRGHELMLGFERFHKACCEICPECRLLERSE